MSRAMSCRRDSVKVSLEKWLAAVLMEREEMAEMGSGSTGWKPVFHDRRDAFLPLEFGHVDEADLVAGEGFDRFG